MYPTTIPKSFKTISAILLILSILLSSGCKSVESKPHLQLFYGHYSVGLAYNWFIPLGSTKPYFLAPDQIPKDVFAFFDKQPSHPSYDGDERSIYLEVYGYLAQASLSGCPDQPQLHVYKVIRYEKAREDFIKSRKKQCDDNQA